MMRKKPKANIKIFLIAIVCLLVFSIVLGFGSVLAISRGYSTTDTGLQTGMVVSLSVDDASNSSVERTTEESVSRVVGVVTTFDDSLVTVSSGDSKVLVESEGQSEAYVSDINGEIKKGDQLVISPLKGILMKSGNIPSTVIAIAADIPTESTSYTYLEGNDSKDTQISKVLINLNNQGGSNTAGTQSDSVLAKIGRSVAGKEISEIRVLVALILFVIVLIAEGAIIYGAVSSAVTSLGRNPLGKKIINQELYKVIGVALMVMLVGLAAVYGVLRV